MSEIKALERLREYASGCVGGLGGDFLSITADEIEAEIADRYMLLPVDADDVPIHVGDKMEYKNPNDDDKPFTVLGVNNDGDVFHCLEDKRLVPTCISLANCLYHVKPRTLEDILNDRINDVLRVMTSGIGIALETALNDSFGEECADEIRELLGGDAS